MSDVVPIRLLAGRSKRLSLTFTQANDDGTESPIAGATVVASARNAVTGASIGMDVSATATTPTNVYRATLPATVFDQPPGTRIELRMVANGERFSVVGEIVAGY